MEASKNPSKICSWEIDDSEENVSVSTKCKVCHVDFEQSTIYKHISHKPSCRAKYSNEEIKVYQEWARDKRNERKREAYEPVKSKKSPNNQIRHATRWEAGGAAAPPDFGGSVNPISTRGDTLSPPSTTCPPGFLTLVACLIFIFLSYNNSTNSKCEIVLWMYIKRRLIVNFVHDRKSAKSLMLDKTIQFWNSG